MEQTTGDHTAQAPASTDEPQRRRLGRLLPGLVLIAAVLAWITVTADSEPSPDDAAQAPSTLPEAGLPETEPPPPGLPDTATADGPEAAGPAYEPFALTPSDGLADMAQVQAVVPYPYLTQGPALGLCVAGRTFACTDIATSELVVEATRSSVTATLPRRFTTRIGDIHDCVADSPCELRLWVFDFRIEERNLSLTFADGPVPPGLTVSAETDGDGRLLLAVPERHYEPWLCLAGLDRACTKLDRQAADETAAADDDRGGWLMAVEPADAVVTPRGPFSCADHGPCEIRFVTRDGSFVEPLAVTPPAPQSEERPRLAVRPSGGLAHGRQVQILLTDTADARFPVWLCAVEARLCASLGVLDADRPTLLRLPRMLADRHGVTPVDSVDCALAACELRAVVGDRLVIAPLSFDAGLPAPATPQLAVTEPGPFRDGQKVPIRGRGFFGPAVPGSAHVATAVRLCEAPNATPAECTVVLDSSEGIAGDGTIDTVIRIPPSSAWRQTLGLDGNRRLACESGCWVVVDQALEVPSAFAPIDLVRSDDPRLP